MRRALPALLLLATLACRKPPAADPAYAAEIGTARALREKRLASENGWLTLTLGKPGVYAWDLPDPPDPRTTDLAAYTKLMLRAAENILQPMGITASALRQLVVGRSLALPLLVEAPIRHIYA